MSHGYLQNSVKLYEGGRQCAMQFSMTPDPSSKRDSDRHGRGGPGRRVRAWTGAAGLADTLRTLRHPCPGSKPGGRLPASVPCHRRGRCDYGLGSERQGGLWGEGGGVAPGLGRRQCRMTRRNRTPGSLSHRQPRWTERPRQTGHRDCPAETASPPRDTFEERQPDHRETTQCGKQDLFTEPAE